MDITNQDPTQPKLSPKIFFAGEFIANVGTVNNSLASYFTTKNFAVNDYSPEDYKVVEDERSKIFNVPTQTAKRFFDPKFATLLKHEILSDD